MNISEEDYLAHYGILRRSGRYPWGSGGPEYASNESFLGMVDGMKKKGMTEPEIAAGLGISTTQLRAAKSIAKTEYRQSQIGMAQRLKDKGWGNSAIAERMSLNESSVRALLAPGVKDRADVLQATASMLRDQVNQKGLIDIGSGVEGSGSLIGVSATKLATAVAVLKEEGYTVHNIKAPQLGTGKYTERKVLAPPGTTFGDVYRRMDEIKLIDDVHTDDGGRSYLGIQPPISVSSKRVKVRYAEDGGADADGVVYVRRGKDDISLGRANYAQVRIAVDGTHYIKGMAVYKDDMPAGVDLIFNTNKNNTGNKLDALKAMKNDPDNPFGSAVRQLVDANGKVKSAMNIVNEEGDWGNWSKTLSSQMLSKQSPGLAKDQLDMAYSRKKREFDEIMALTNPAVKRKLLESFADDADSSAVHLKASALPRQKTQVILPVNSLKDDEIYAPNFRNGENVVLIRYPHGGIFEIPQLKVNNRHPEAKSMLGQAVDAVGINHKVAGRLSGADFDGDTVLVIPNNKGMVKNAPALEGLKNFDPVRSYPAYEGMKPMSSRTKQLEMGDVSNLITDMTIKGAPFNEIARAVRHSMVVIDAEKHKLNYRQSAVDNGIAQLKAKYQGGANRGSATIISRASSELRVAERKPRSAAKGGPIDRATGERVWENTGATYVNGRNQVVQKTTKTTRLGEAKDAHDLSSGAPVERIYADHSNRLKSLANQARKAQVNVETTPYSPSAKAAYAKEVETLNSKLAIAIRNRPLERNAQAIANAVVNLKRRANPDMDAAELKKVKSQALAEARVRTGAKKERVDITDSEWAAIQAGAISTNKLNQILANADLDRVKELATPKTKVLMDGSATARARQMMNNGYTQAEIADALGVSVSTLKSGLE